LYDHFLAGNELASALMYLAFGLLIAWNIHALALMSRGLRARERSG
jgi:hypothetical protein